MKISDKLTLKKKKILSIQITWAKRKIFLRMKQLIVQTYIKNSCILPGAVAQKFICIVKKKKKKEKKKKEMNRN